MKKNLPERVIKREMRFGRFAEPVCNLAYNLVSIINETITT
jgi:hypothetical protein